MKFVTFNIRCDYGQDGNNNYQFREPLIVETLRREMPDAVGFQEMLPHVKARLEQALPEYMLLGCGREKDFGGESMTVAVRKESFEPVKLDVFWLSETPNVPGSRFEEQSDCPRLCTHLLLRQKAENRLLHLYNTHLDHVSGYARTLGLQSVMKRIKQDEKEWPAPAVLMGDFNAEPGDAEMRTMEEYPAFKRVGAELPGTFHDFGRLDKPLKIDYIYLAELEPVSCRLWTDEREGVFLSDHRPVEAVCRFR